MTQRELELVKRFKTLVGERLHVDQVIVFGSRARGHAGPESDLDVLVVTEEPITDGVFSFLSECAWESSFGSGIVLTPVAYSRSEWSEGPERSSLLAQTVRREGIPV